MAASKAAAAAASQVVVEEEEVEEEEEEDREGSETDEHPRRTAVAKRANSRCHSLTGWRLTSSPLRPQLTPIRRRRVSDTHTHSLTHFPNASLKSVGTGPECRKDSHESRG